VTAELLLLALCGAVYPPIFAIVVVILGRPDPRRLLAAYVVGALLISTATGFGIVAALRAGHVFEDHDRSLSPAVDLAAGLIALFIAFFLATKRDRRLRARRGQGRGRGADGRDPWSSRVFERDSIGMTFLAGVALNLPGMSYMVALKDIAAAHQGRARTQLRSSPST
jgi:Sap, sulfolipid-1-addressing protein